MRRTISLSLLATATLVAAPVSAGGKFAVPAGCEVYATVQLRGCQVSQHYRCDADAPGDQWAVYLNEDGAFYATRTDRETRWIRSFDLINGEVDELADEQDPASFDALIGTGRDDYSFSTRSTSGQVRYYEGHDVLTGKTRVIDGVKLDQTEFELTARDEDGAVLWHRQGQQLVSRDWRTFWPDQETYQTAGEESVTTVDTPMTFALPGQAGYLATEPQFECAGMVEIGFSRGAGQ